jgi:hypothetical protein
MGKLLTLNDLLSGSRPFDDHKVSHQGVYFEVYIDLDGDVWATLPYEDAIEAFWSWIGAPTQPEFTVFVDYTTGQLPPRFFNEANNQDRS